jgi:hypothetical protein
MALQISLTEAESTTGSAYINAYARISKQEFDTNTGFVTVFVDVHASRQARLDGKGVVGGKPYQGRPGVDMPNLNDPLPLGVFSTLYNWLKSNFPEFGAAADV